MNHAHHNGLLSAANQHISIPLHCNICPKKPDFSDVSHLLTHIASKGHLSHYYKVKVKAGTDRASKIISDEYDQWYQDWNVQDLMQERMSQKEKKKGSVNSASASRRGSVTSTTSAPRRTPAANSMPPRRSLRESTLDPQLGVRIKQEPMSRSTTPLSALSLDPATMNRAYAPPMQGWPGTPYIDSPVSTQGSLLDSLYCTPSSDDEPEAELPRRRRNKKRNDSGSTRSLFTEDTGEFDDGSGENSKLKGIIHPGMGLFDAATEDQRRKRNQKKPISIIQHLQETSEIVEPTECVFDAIGRLRRERVITGSPDSDDDPLSGEEMPEPSSPPKKAARKPRQPLAERNTNSGGRVAKRRREPHHPARRQNKRLPSYPVPSNSDDDLTYGQPPAPRVRTGLSIHRDNSGPDITFENPAPMRNLTAGFQHPLQSAHAPNGYSNGYLSRSHMHQGPGQFRPASSNHMGGVPQSNFGSFGQLNSQNMFHNIGFLGSNPFQFTNSQGPQPFQIGQQQFGGFGSGLFGNDSAFQFPNGHAHNHSRGAESQSAWDPFDGFAMHEMRMQNAAADVGSQMNGVNGDLSSVNPMFFSSNRGVPEDDEATLSPPQSDRGV